MKPSPVSFGSRSGQSLILVVVAMSIVLFGALGLAIDGAQMFAQRQMAQAAADAAAQAGIMSIFTGTNITSPYPFGALPSASSVCTAADARTPCIYARNNGFGGTAADTVTLSFPAAVSGVMLSPLVTVPAITVTVSRTLNTGLIQFVGAAATSSITAKATAGIVHSVSPTCVYVLQTTAQDSFDAGVASTVAINGCGIAVNSSDHDAVNISARSTVTSSAFTVVGRAVITSGATATPAPVTVPTAVADPLLALPSPTVGGCDFTNYAPAMGNWTLNPGTYCGTGITIGAGSTATFNPGTYIINGGAVTLNGGSTSTGNGVMFYLTAPPPYTPAVNISSGASATFSAPTSGPYMGVAFYQDRSSPQSSGGGTFWGGAPMQITGTLYFPTATVQFSNGASVANYSTAIVAMRVRFKNGSSIKYDPTGLLTGLFGKAVALLQ